MHGPIYLIAGVTAALLAFVVAVVLRMKLRNSEDSPTARKWFGWFIGSIGTLCILAYYANGDGTPDSIAMGWAFAVFGGYMVESGRLRQRISELETSVNFLVGSPNRQIPH